MNLIETERLANLGSEEWIADALCQFPQCLT
jgi:hypothetical protein